MLLAAAAFAGLLSGWAAILQYHLRHPGLAALALLAPAAVLVASLAAGALFVIPPACAIAACAFAAVSAELVLSRMARAICDDCDPRGASVRALKETAPVFAAAAGVTVAALFALSPAPPDALVPAVLVAAAMLPAFGAGWIAGRLSYSERFIAAANAARERRERIADALSFLAVPRWALSIAGSAIVLSTVAFFGAAPLREIAAPSFFAARLGLAALAAFSASVLLLRDWRSAAAVTLALAADVLFGLWAAESGAGFVLPSVALAACAVPPMWLARAAAKHARDGDNAATAMLRALHGRGADAILAATLPALGWSAALLAGLAVRFETAAAFASLAAAAFAFPAFAVALHALLPRYRTADEVFGRR